MLSMDEKIALCKKEYEELPNIKLVADKTGIKWQTVYWYLKKAGVEVKGDKALYGSTKDKFAHKGEEYIQKILPSAINQNLYSYQPKVDFIIENKSLHSSLLAHKVSLLKLTAIYLVNQRKLNLKLTETSRVILKLLVKVLRKSKLQD